MFAVKSGGLVDLVLVLDGAKPLLRGAVPRNTLVARSIPLGQPSVAVVGFVGGCTKVFNTVVCRVTVDVIQHHRRIVAVHSPDDAMHQVFFVIDPNSEISPAVDAACF